jgi:hypothetical protein
MATCALVLLVLFQMPSELDRLAGKVLGEDQDE